MHTSRPLAFIVLALVTVLGLTFSACGSQQPAAQSSAQPSASAKSSAQPSASASASAQPSQSAAPKAPATPVKVGVLLGLSGPVGPVGNQQLMGTQIAIEEINKAGGILGRQVELVIRDDGGDPTKSRTTAEELVEKEKVAFIIGPTLSSPAMGVHPYLTEQKVLNLTSAAAEAATDPVKFPYAFTVSPHNGFIGKTIFDYAVNSLKLTKIALLSESTALGKEAQGILKPLFEAKGITPVVQDEYAVGALDYAPQLNKARSAGADGLIVWSGNSTDMVRFMKNLQSMGWDVPVLSTSNLADSAVVQGVGADGLKKAYAQSHRPITFSASSPLSQKTIDFREKVRAKLNGENPIKTSILNVTSFYDGVSLVKAAADKAGSLDTLKLKASMESFNQWPGVYATWTFTPTVHKPLGDDDGTMVLAATCKDAVCEKAPNAP